jgi:hypothetical protein
MTVREREKRVWAAFALHVGAAAMLSLATLALVFVGRDSLPAWLVVLGLALLAAGYCYSGLPWWRRLDHMERDGWLLAWFWGGGFAGTVALLATAALAGVGSDWFKGAFLAMGAQSLGHIVFQIVWRQMHRAAAA